MPQQALTTPHVIPAEAGIHRSPDSQWTPACAGVTTKMIFIPSRGLQAREYSSE